MSTQNSVFTTDETWKQEAAAEKATLAAASTTAPPQPNAPSLPPGKAGIAIVGDPETGIMRFDLSGGETPVSLIVEPLQLLQLGNHIISATIAFIAQLNQQPDDPANAGDQSSVPVETGDTSPAEANPDAPKLKYSPDHTLN